MSNPESKEQAVVRGPIAIESVPWKSWGENARFAGKYRHLTERWGDYHVGVLIEELAPGTQSCPAHYHHKEEEHVLMLEGTATLRLGDQTHELVAGDYVCFPAGQAAGHCLINRSDAPCRYLMIGEKKADEVAVYTDTNKFMVRGMGVFDRGATKGYWEGEPTELAECMGKTEGRVPGTKA